MLSGVCHKGRETTRRLTMPPPRPPPPILAKPPSLRASSEACSSTDTGAARLAVARVARVIKSVKRMSSYVKMMV